MAKEDFLIHHVFKILHVVSLRFAFNPLRRKGLLYHFTLANSRRFYLSSGWTQTYYFRFLYEQVDGVAICVPLGPLFASIFLSLY